MAASWDSLVRVLQQVHGYPGCGSRHAVMLVVVCSGGVR